MNKLESIIAFFCENYPHKSELSNARLTKLVYLADWFGALTNEKTVSGIDWIFNHYGPYVKDVENCASESPIFKVIADANRYGAPKKIISLAQEINENSVSLDDVEKRILSFVTEKTKDLYFNDFIEYVYSTYPVSSQSRYSSLDLVALAKEYNLVN